MRILPHKTIMYLRYENTNIKKWSIFKYESIWMHRHIRYSNSMTSNEKNSYKIFIKVLYRLYFSISLACWICMNNEQWIKGKSKLHYLTFSNIIDSSKTTGFSMLNLLKELFVSLHYLLFFINLRTLDDNVGKVLKMLPSI